MREPFFNAIVFPNMVPVQQSIETPRIEDVGAETEKELQRIRFSTLIQGGDRVGITVGSRGLASIGELLGVLIHAIRDAGGEPFIIPSMGSHGGGTAEGQIRVLQSLGIDEKSMGVPIRASGESEKIGTTENGTPVYVSREVLADTDKLVLLNRVKSHTEYSGSIESGICKMCAIGLGNPRGAKVVHELALDLGYERTIVEAGLYIIEKLPIVCAVATVENYYHEVSHVKALLPENILREEQNLLRIAKANTGQLPFDRLDLLIVDEIGKNISGAGLDTDVIGRIMVYGQQEPPKPDIKRIVVLDITDESHGNAIGIGLADFTVKRLLDKIDRESTYLNCITAQTPEKGRLPIWFHSDREAIGVALLSIGSVKPAGARVVHIKNTEEVRYVEVSESLLKETEKREDLETTGELKPMEFDENGNLNRI
jgi:hypothetical protein